VRLDHVASIIVNANHEARMASGSHETVLVKPPLRAIVIWLSIATLMTATDVAKAGPFRDFLRAIRSDVMVVTARFAARLVSNQVMQRVEGNVSCQCEKSDAHKPMSNLLALLRVRMVAETPEQNNA